MLLGTTVVSFEGGLASWVLAVEGPGTVLVVTDVALGAAVVCRDSVEGSVLVVVSNLTLVKVASLNARLTGDIFDESLVK